MLYLLSKRRFLVQLVFIFSINLRKNCDQSVLTDILLIIFSMLINCYTISQSILDLHREF